jgi:hypothetical protein
MDKNEAISTISTIFKKVEQSDDQQIKIIDKLDMILINLSIQEAHIHGATGIKPIIDELERLIHIMKSNNKTLIQENRKPLETAISYLNSYIKDGDFDGSIK